jgi:hypothetical protein
VNYVKVQEFCVDCGDSFIPGHPSIDGELVKGKKIRVSIDKIGLNVFSL